jgi:hypothetical protein
VSDLKRRITKLHRQRPPALDRHELGVVWYPSTLSGDALRQWLQALRCPCGIPDCPERVAILLPRKEARHD